MAQPQQTAQRLARRLACLALLGAALPGVALAQTPAQSQRTSPADTVSWTVAVQSADAAKPGGRVSVTLDGAVLDGWHVYALEQPSRGPIPMSVWLEPNEIVTADGEPSATAPTRTFDKSFGFDTQYYSAPFKLTVPVRLKKGLASGPQQIPVSVQFQTCNGKTCQPPKTVHLTASINVRAGG